MPLIKRAIKKMHHDRKVTKQNNTKRDSLKKAMKLHRKSPTTKTLTTVFSLLDKTAKSSIIHKNKASRLKSRLSKLLISK